MVRFGLAGLGRIGEIHARNIVAHPRSKLSAVFDTDAEKAAKAAGRFDCESSPTFEAMLANRSIDAVLIASPTDKHADQAVAAARAGKAVLCEKPLSLDLATARRCSTLIAARGAPFMIALNKRFDPSIAELRTRLRAGEIGQIEMMTLTGKDPAPPHEAFIGTSGGLFRDMMVHDIDLAVFLSGEFPVEVWAAGSVKISEAFARANDFDTASVIMKTATGVIITQTLSRRSSIGFDQRIEVHGSAGTLRTTNHPISHLESLTAAGSMQPPLLHSFLERFAASYAAELDHFIDCMESGRPIDLDVSHAVAIQAVADAVTQAALSGQHTVVGDLQAVS